MEVLDCNLSEDFITHIRHKLDNFNPDIIGLSMMFDNSYTALKDIATVIKGYDKSTIVVLGGAAATASYTAIISELDTIDAICFDEGEQPMRGLINSDNMHAYLQSDPSWITRRSLKEGIVPKKAAIQNLDAVIDIDHSLVNIAQYQMQEAFSPFADITKPRNQFFMVTSRGCPFKCVFCMRSADNDQSMRYASVPAIMAHLKSLIRDYDMNILTLYDDQLLLDKERAKHLFKELGTLNLKRIECPNGLSVAFMDEELIRLMRNANMDTVYLAIESGSPYVLNNLMHKPLKLSTVKPIVKLLRQYNFWIQGFFVSGIPGETDAHRDETLNFINNLGLDWASFSLAIPSRGSELYNICIENGYIRKDMRVDELETDTYIINVPGYPPEYVAKRTYLMNLDVNFVHNYRMRNGEYKIAAAAFSDVIKRHPNHAFAHFYLSKALAAQKEDTLATISLDTFNKIIKNDLSWKEYTDYFSITNIGSGK